MSRIFNVTASLVGLFFLSPLFLVIAFLLKIQDGGTVFYRARRVGLHGREYQLFKFRTMVNGADQKGAGITTSGDSRITPVGKFLRKYKLDEFPQLLNVIKGDMNLVGPRPEDPRYTALYDPHQKKILNFLPGITSPASLRFKNEAELLSGMNWEDIYTREILPQKIEMDIKYFQNNSLLSDIELIFYTIFGIMDWFSNIKNKK